VRRFVHVLIGACLLVVGGCDAGATRSATSSPVPAVDPKAEWEPVLDRAQLTTAEAGPAMATDYAMAAALPCGKAFTSTLWAERAWLHAEAEGGPVVYTVAAYDPKPGPAIATQARVSLSTCSTWSPDPRLELVDLDELAVEQPSGVDPAFAFCYRVNFVGGPTMGQHGFACTAFVARGHLLASIGGSAQTLILAQEYTKTLVPLAASALMRLVPTV
jgi:hypothetical protein